MVDCWVEDEEMTLCSAKSWVKRDLIYAIWEDEKAAEVGLGDTGDGDGEKVTVGEGVGVGKVVTTGVACLPELGKKKS